MSGAVKRTVNRLAGGPIGRTLLTLACTAAIACAVPNHTGGGATSGTEYRNGRWFDGTTFLDRTMYVVGDHFQTRRPAHVDSSVDLAGGYVVPPFADAHQHFLEPGRIGAYVNAHLADGIFYVRDQANAPYIRRQIAPALNTPASIDFVSANQGWTSSRGHPIEIIRQGVQLGAYPASWLKDSLDIGAVVIADTPEDVARKWPLFLAGNPKPDLVKVFLIRSERFAATANDPKFDYDRGLDPALVPEIVKRAHAAGLKVSAHIYTAGDFRNAVRGGVDWIAHLPGGRETDPAPFLLTDADAEEAARRGVSVVTTVAMRRDSALTARIMREQYLPNIAVLRKHGVQLLIGSDLFRGTDVLEARTLASSGAFTNLELLRLWSVDTPRAIFPGRRIGRLDDGYEASFLVLRGNPLDDFSNTGKIAMRVKQGARLRDFATAQ